MEEMVFRSVTQHAAALGEKEYSSVELTRAYLSQIEARDGEIGAFLTVDAKGALAAAEASDARRARGEARGDLDGIPFGVKDNFCTAGLRTTCASRMLEHFVPSYDATAVARLTQAGAVLLGKLSLDEFAMGSSNERSAFGVTRNPHALDRVAGGSSGGSASALAAGEVAFSLGSDTGGSVRQPAAFCGVYGLKASYGAISRYGMIALASSLDCVGVLSRTASDGALICEALRGVDPLDATACSAVAKEEKRPLRIARIDGFREESFAPEVREATERAIGVFLRHGASFGEISLPTPKDALAAYSVLVSAEAASELARYDGIRFGEGIDGEDLFSLYARTRGAGLGEEVKRRILFGNYVLQNERRRAYYDTALAVREQVRLGLLKVFEEYDLILSPVTPTAAFPIGKVRTPEEMYQADLCTVYANLAGLPALSVPFGKAADGLPLAVQLTARPFAEATLYGAAAILENEDQK